MDTMVLDCNTVFLYIGSDCNEDFGLQRVKKMLAAYYTPHRVLAILRKEKLDT